MNKDVCFECGTIAELGVFGDTKICVRCALRKVDFLAEALGDLGKKFAKLEKRGPRVAGEGIRDPKK